MELIKLSFIESQGSSEQFICPFESRIKSRDYDRFAEATDNASTFTPARLSKIARDIMSPSTDGVQQSVIEGGWGERRIQFAMVVCVSNADRSSSYEYIVGTTDHSEYSTLSGKQVRFDPKMKMYITSITRINLGQARGRNGTIWQPTIKAHDQILHRSAVLGNRRRGPDGSLATILRPTDLFRRNKGSKHFFAGSDREDDFADGGNDDNMVVNLCGTFNSALKMVNLNHNTISGHLSKSLGSYVEASASPSSAYMDDGDHDSDQVLRNACDVTDENVIEDDPFIERLTRWSNIVQQGYILYGELMEANPEFDENKIPFMPVELNKNLIGWDGRSNWNDSTPAAIAANIIKNTLPALMINSMFSEVTLTLNTRARFGESKCVVSFAQPFVDGLNVQATMPYFEGTAANVLLNEVSSNGIFEVDAFISANIDGEIEIRIAMDNDPEEFFVSPVFAGSFSAPVLGHNGRQVDNLSNGIVKLAGEMSKRRSASEGMERRPGISTSTDIGSARRETTLAPRNDRRSDADGDSSSSRRSGRDRDKVTW